MIYNTETQPQCSAGIAVQFPDNRGRTNVLNRQANVWNATCYHPISFMAYVYTNYTVFKLRALIVCCVCLVKRNPVEKTLSVWLSHMLDIVTGQNFCGDSSTESIS